MRRAGTATPWRVHVRRMRPLAWVAAVVVLAMLAALQLVVSEGVDAGGERRAVLRERHRATWHCNLLPTQDERLACRAGLR